MQVFVLKQLFSSIIKLIISKISVKWVGKVLLNRPDPDTQPTCLKAATDLTAAQAPLEWPIIIVFSSTARLSFINGSQRDLREIVRNKNKKKHATRVVL